MADLPLNFTSLLEWGWYQSMQFWAQKASLTLPTLSVSIIGGNVMIKHCSRCLESWTFYFLHLFSIWNPLLSASPVYGLHFKLPSHSIGWSGHEFCAFLGSEALTHLIACRIAIAQLESRRQLPRMDLVVSGSHIDTTSWDLPAICFHVAWSNLCHWAVIRRSGVPENGSPGLPASASHSKQGTGNGLNFPRPRNLPKAPSFGAWNVTPNGEILQIVCLEFIAAHRRLFCVVVDDDHPFSNLFFLCYGRYILHQEGVWRTSLKRLPQRPALRKSHECQPNRFLIISVYAYVCIYIVYVHIDIYIYIITYNNIIYLDEQ